MLAGKWSHRRCNLTTCHRIAHVNYWVTFNPPKNNINLDPWYWHANLSRDFPATYVTTKQKADIGNCSKVFVQTDTGTHISLLNISYKNVFMTIVWQSRQIWKIREASDRHNQLKTIIPCSCVTGTECTAQLSGHNTAFYKFQQLLPAVTIPLVFQLVGKECLVSCNIPNLPENFCRTQTRQLN